MKIAITGHRPNKLGNDYNLTSPLVRSIKKEIIDTVLNYIGKEPTLITGMALGIDTLFAQIAIGLRLPFIAAIPCMEQEKMWRQESKRLYNELIHHSLCTKKYISSNNYEFAPNCMQKRNEWMVDNCDLLIAVWDGSTGGTKNCVDYAKSKAKDIIYINPKNHEQRTTNQTGI